MKRRHFLKNTILALPWLTICTLKKNGLPNIVMIQLDDLGWSDLGCYGNSYHETTNIDRIAAEGMRFTQAYAAAPICSPTRVSIITGEYPARLNMTGQPGYKKDDQSNRILLHPDFKTELPENMLTLAESLTSAGYRCVNVGKTNFGAKPKDVGFDLNFGGSDNEITHQCVRFIRQNKHTPFWLYCNYHWPHIPLETEQALIRKHEKKIKPRQNINPKYAAILEMIDDAVGQILAAIREQGLEDNTMVIITSDNGGFLGYKPEPFVTTNAPLRDGKASLYEGGIRVPLIIKWPGVIKASSRCNVPVMSIDYFPTFCDIIGYTYDKSHTVDGKSIYSLLLDDGSISKRPLFWHWPHYRRSMPRIHASPSSAIRYENYKLLEFFEDGHLELYDLEKDPAEKNNLVNTHKEIREKLHTMLKTWRNKVGAQLPARNPAI